jgi:glycosyltransferase involved in cell wall biosynthesis
VKVLHLAPLWFPVARDSLGGVETFLAALLPALERSGAEPTLLATADSRVDVELTPVASDNLYSLEASLWQYAHFEQHQLFMALERSADVALIHSHVGPGAFLLSAMADVPVLHTVHNPVGEDLEWLVERHEDLWLSTVGEFQARKLRGRGARRCTTIHNGIEVSRFDFRSEPGDGLVFLGRIDEEKGTHLAVETARALHMPITLAGPAVDGDYFEEMIRPSLGNGATYVGVVGHREKNELLGSARCVLMPSIVHEGCPIVPMEAMACGTPVVALANGALPEIVEAGVTGFTTTSPSELPDLVERASGLDRTGVRRRSEERFDIAQVAQRYASLYAEIVDDGRS